MNESNNQAAQVLTDEQLAAGMRELFAHPKQETWEDTIQRVYSAIAKLQAATPASEGQLLRELQRAYRCIQGMHNALTRGVPFAAEAYHAPTIAAAKRFVFEGAMDGADYFEGKHVSVLHDALRLPQVKGNDAP